MTVRVLVSAALVAGLAAVFVLNASAKMPDFDVYWRAGARALAAEPLYRAEDEHYQFKYLPAFALLAIPIAFVPLSVAKALWFAVSAGLAAALIASSLALLPDRRKPPWLLIVVTLVVMAKFYGHELVLGQVNFLFATMIVLAVLLLQKGHDAPAGILIALAVIVKPYAAIFVPWLAGLGAPRALAAAGLALAAALALPAAIYGIDGTVTLHQDWWRTVTESTAPNLLNADNVSIAGMFAKWLGPGSLATALTGLTSLLALAAAVLVVRRRGTVASPAGLEAALLLTLIPLLSPQGWDYVFLVSTPAVIYLANYDRVLPAVQRLLTAIALATVGFSLYDVMGRRAYASFMALSIISVCFLVVVSSLVTLRVRRAA